MADQRLEDERSDVSIATSRSARCAGEDGIGQRCWALGEGRLRAEYHADRRDRPPDARSRAACRRRRRAMLPARRCPICCPAAIASPNGSRALSSANSPACEGGALAAALADWVRDNARLCAGREQRRRRPRSMTFADAPGRLPRLCASARRAGARRRDPGAVRLRLCARRRPARFPCRRRTVARRRLAPGRRDRHGACGDLARVAVGRDATDIAFMTVFGTRDHALSRRVSGAPAAGTQAVRVARSHRRNASRRTSHDRTSDETRAGQHVGAPDEAGRSRRSPPGCGQDESIAERLAEEPRKQGGATRRRARRIDGRRPIRPSTQPVHHHRAARIVGL